MSARRQRLRRMRAALFALLAVAACSAHRVPPAERSQPDASLASEPLREPWAAAPSVRVDTTTERARLDRELAKLPAAPRDRAWVLRKLEYMHEIDQLVRVPPIDSMAMYAVDHQNTVDLQGLIKIHGWFTLDEWGRDAEESAFLVAQHSPDPAFRKAALGRYERLRVARQVPLGHYALLFDRVAAMDEGRPQRYGTQGMCKPGKGWEALPIEDPEHLDERRARVGLGPYSEYVPEVSARCPP
jgi:hypothetical protein